MEKIITVRRVKVVNSNGDEIQFKRKLKRKFETIEELEEYRNNLSRILTALHREPRKVQFFTTQKRLYVLKETASSTVKLKTYNYKKTVRECERLLDMNIDQYYKIYVDNLSGVPLKKFLNIKDNKD